MSHKTIETTQAERKASWLKVTAIGFAEGDPARLSFYWLMTLRDGTQRRCVQNARVTEERLIQRLRTEIAPGDEIEVLTELDKSFSSCPTVLRDFCAAMRQR